VQAISSREYTLRVFDGLLTGDSAAAWNATATMLIVAGACLLLAVWRLRRIQIS
jgi:hypothetical protein